MSRDCLRLAHAHLKRGAYPVSEADRLALAPMT